MWPDTFGLACCAIEMMSIVSSRYDIARFGMEAFRSSPRQADLLIVSGRVAHKMAAPLRQIYDQMLEPKWVIAMGACASSGGMFNNYTILQGVDRIVPVDIYVPFCPPRPEALMEGIIRLHEAHQAGVAAGVRAQAGGCDVSYDALPGFVEREGVVRRDDGDDRARRASATRARTRATSSASRCSSTSSPPTTWAGAAKGVSGLHRDRERARHQLPVDAGPADAARAEAEALLRQLPPARAAAAAAARAPAVLARRRRRRCRASISVWPTADWHEREQFDLMGITLRRASEPAAPPDGGRLGRAPAAQGLSDRRRAGALLGRRMTIAPERAPRLADRPAPYEGSRIPSPVPTILPVPEDAARRATTSCRINFGPNHPSTHGVLRLIVDLDGEKVVGLDAVIGYLHTGFEKTMETKTWWKCVTYPERIDYVGYQNNELTFVLAVEKLLALEVPEKATWMRMLLCELNRIHSHLIFLGTSALELGAVSMFWYCFREREMIIDLYEMVTGQRMHTRYFQIGGLAEDIPEGFYAQCREFVEWMPNALERLPDAARPQRDLARAHEGRRPALRRRRDRARADRPGTRARRASTGTCAATSRTSRTTNVDFHVPVYPERRRLRPLPRSRRRDARVDAHRRPVPAPARADEGPPVDRRRPQGRAAAARGAAHVDGVAHPPLQDRDRGLPRARGRGLRADRVAARRAGLLPRVATAGRSRGACISVRRRSSRSRRRRRARTTRSSPT